jgi:hypothetical protein
LYVYITKDSGLTHKECVDFIVSEARLHYNFTETKLGAAHNGADLLAYKCAQLNVDYLGNSLAPHH